MGRSVKNKCPLLMTEKRGGHYRVFFSTLKKNHVPVFSNGKKVSLDQLVYRNMEVDGGNDEAAPLFKKASSILQDEIKNMIH